MASSPASDAASSEGPEKEEFMRKLQEYHNERGTVLDPAPKVGNRNVDLYKLYKRVTEEGGYDAVSDTKNNKLMWRKLGTEFHLGSSAVATLAFTLKTAYYKNLAAYEIKYFHQREPPPKEILEDVTAKGGDLLNRSVENFSKPLTKEERLAESAGMDPNAPDQQTPHKENGEQEDASNTIGRATRGLRQAPPARQLFQGEVVQPRATRQVSKEAGSPAPNMNPYATVNGAYGINSVPQSLAGYEPRPQLPAQLRPVMTPGNNFDKFKEEQKRIRDARAAFARGDGNRHRPPPGLVPPGTGFQGPTIYTRTLQSLQSGILEEQEYALYHLTKISHERGDRFRFDHFAGLAEALISKVLEVGSLVLDVEWTIGFAESADTQDPEQVITDSAHPADVSFSRKRKRADKLEPEEFSRRLTLVNEAALILRNMIMMDFNAEYISRLPTSRAFLVLLLNLPHQASTAELLQYALDMAEQLTRYMTPQDHNDQLFTSLFAFIDRSDRGLILSAIRSICRFGMIPQQSPPLSLIPPRMIQRLTSWMVLEDEDLRAASLDLLYQYTARPTNVRTFIKSTDAPSFVRQLVRLLLHGARCIEFKEQPGSTIDQDTAPTETTKTPNTDSVIPLIPTPYVQHLLSYSEPERSSAWLRSCFTESPEGEITQIALWQAYQLPFAQYAHTHPLLPAKDFITNVSTTFSKASAQVMTANDTGPPRFVIRGIKPRAVPVDAKGRGFLKCLWREPPRDTHMTDGVNNSAEGEPHDCGAFARDAQGLWEHIVTSHLQLSKTQANAEDGTATEKWDFTPKPGMKYGCHWAGCRKFQTSKTASPYEVGMHVKIHMPDTSEKSFQRQRYNFASANGSATSKDSAASAHALSRTLQSANTALDERNEPAGLPLVSCLVLRNLARNMHRLASLSPNTPDADIDNESVAGSPKMPRDSTNTSPRHRKAQGQGVADGVGDLELVSRCFDPVREQIFGTMAVNGTLREVLGGLVVAVEGG